MPTLLERQELAWALGALLPRQETYQRVKDYYAGRHERMISEKRLQTVFGRLFDNFRLNLCKPVADALVDRLQISSFSNTGLGDGQDAEPDDDAQEIWKRNRMARRSGHVHLESIVAGDSYIIVWPNEKGLATIYPQGASSVAVDYSSDEPGVVTRAAKLWRSDKDTVRLTLYYPDRLERYVAKRSLTNIDAMPQDQAEEMRRELDTTTGTHPSVVGSDWIRPDAFSEYTEDGNYIVENPYGIVPVFHFANNADIGERGISELHDALPVQDMLNYLAFNVLVGTEFQAFPQRYATGIDPTNIPKDANGKPINPYKTGPDRMWIATPTDQGTPQFGELSAANLTQLDDVKRSAGLDMAQVTQTPPHYFAMTSNLVSGESQKTAEQKLDAKVADRTLAFGEVWAAALALAVKIDRGLARDGLELDCNWKNTKPRVELDEWTVAKLKAELGVSREQILREQGYTEEQIIQFKEEAGGSLNVQQGVPVPGQQPGFARATNGRTSLVDLLAGNTNTEDTAMPNPQ